jgi:sulfoxide reductase heme-binding subunit YedZ
VSFAGPGLWYATRAAGLVTLMLLTASTALGIATGTRLASMRWPRFLVIGLHRNIALLALLFLAVHVGTTVIDTYTSIGLQDAVVPFLSGYHRLWLGLGAIASDLFLVLIATSLLRHRMRPQLWRTVHWTGYLCWPVAISHGLGIGTDSGKTWVFYLALTCGAVVAAALTVRLTLVLRFARRVVR